MGSPDRAVRRGPPPAPHHARPGSGRRSRDPPRRLAAGHQCRDQDFPGSPHRRQRRAGGDRSRTASSSFDSQTRWSYGDDQLPFPGRPLGQVILQRRVQRLHLPTPAASLHLQPPGHPSTLHTPSRATFGSGGRLKPPRPLCPPEGRGTNLTPQVLGAGPTPPAPPPPPRGLPSPRRRERKKHPPPPRGEGARERGVRGNSV